MLAAAVQKKLEKHNIYAASCETRNKLVGTPRRGARYFTVKIYKRFVLGFVRWTQLSSFRAGRRAHFVRTVATFWVLRFSFHSV